MIFRKVRHTEAGADHDAETGACAIRIEWAAYGRRVVLEDVGLTMQPGQVIGLFGHNGAGKTSVLRTAFGLVRNWSGEVSVDGRKLPLSGPIGRLQAGLVLVPQGHGIFPDLSVAEHFDLSRAGGRLSREEYRDITAEVLELLPILKNQWRQPAGELSGGQRQMLSIGRSLLSRPRFLFLDEPSVGLAPNLVEDIMRFTGQLASSRDIGILLVEQNVHQALSAVEEVYVLRSGRIVAHRSAADLANSETLLDLF